MANDVHLGFSAIDSAENFLDLDDLDLAGVDVETMDPAGGTTPSTWPCITVTINISANLCSTITASAGCNNY